MATKGGTLAMAGTSVSHYSILAKLSGGAWRTSLSEGLVAGQERRRDLLSVDDALKAVAALTPRKSQVVELRFFARPSVEETAEVHKISPDTVMCDRKFATAAWCLCALFGESSLHGPGRDRPLGSRERRSGA
jgi:hypothetical protein